MKEMNKAKIYIKKSMKSILNEKKFLEKINYPLISNMYYPTMGAPSAVISKYVEKLKDEYAFYIITKTDECHFEPTNEFYISYISSFRHRILQYSLYNIKKGKLF